VLHVGNQAHPLEHARSIVEIAAFVIAAGWGVYTFAYQEVFEPARKPAALNCSASMTHVTLANGDEFVTVLVTDENVGKTYVDVTAENVPVWGRAVTRADAHVTRARSDYGERRVDLARRSIAHGSSSIVLTHPAENQRVNRDNGEATFTL
jgi:hypothetical protein